MNISRRKYIKSCLALLAAYPSRHLLASDVITSSTTMAMGNFQYIYSNLALRESFLDFYTNVFHLYPENEFHQLVHNLTKEKINDKDIYEELLSSIKSIKPILSDFTYALPALAKQKREMTNQSLQLLDKTKTYNGYMEIGTTGRYLSQLEDNLKINDERYLLHTYEAGYGALDIIDRGQLTKIGHYVDMGQYSTSFLKTIEKNSLDLVTVYIGFHHCPLDSRENFISAVRDVIKPKGKLILRDHDARNQDLWRIAALAHDTFNAGTNETWQTNINEKRNFYSIEYITNLLTNLGLRFDGKVLYQKGDPTRNGLMSFTKV